MVVYYLFAKSMNPLTYVIVSSVDVLRICDAGVERNSAIISCCIVLLNCGNAVVELVDLL